MRRSHVIYDKVSVMSQSDIPNINKLRYKEELFLTRSPARVIKYNFDLTSI